jgi:hypothetical protein
MARRTPYTEVEKKNFQRAPHVEGKGDVLYRGFGCLNPKCTRFILVEDKDITDTFNIVCPACKFEHAAGETSIIYDYDLRDRRDNSIFESGKFEILHDDYVQEAKGYKYCIICSTLKPIELFDKHGARQTGRQGECNLCKRLYNSIKNQTRLAEQHREASQKRRLYTELASNPRIDIGKIYERFNNRCFKCGKELSEDREKGARELRGNLDHTLPAKWLWPMTTDNATLLCKGHNGAKAEKWPRDYYNEAELRKLAPLVGIDYHTLKGPEHFNPEALKRLEEAVFVEKLFIRYARYLDELIMLRNKILDATKFDFFKSWPRISDEWVHKADAVRAKR